MYRKFGFLKTVQHVFKCGIKLWNIFKDCPKTALFFVRIVLKLKTASFVIFQSVEFKYDTLFQTV